MTTITDRIDAITQIPPERRTPTPPAPRSVKIELTGRCNYRCGFCALRMRDDQPKRDMDWQFFIRIAGEMRRAGVEELGLFFIGEPFMASELLVQATRYAKKEAGFPYVFITTNGSLATPTRVRGCMEAGLDSLKWSVNNADAEQFREIAGVSEKLWARSLENIRAAKTVRDEVEARTGHRCGLWASSIRYDGEQQARMETLVDQIRPFVDQHYWLPLYSMGSLARERERELGFRPIAGNQGRIGALRDPLPCWSLFTEGHITVDGKLSACCFDADGRWAMADLNEVSFVTAWQSPLFQELRAAHLRKEVQGTICEKCMVYSS